MPSIMKSLVPLLLCVALPWSVVHAQGQPDAAHRPTRMQMCQHEFQAVPADERKAQINACLQRRARAEATVERDCRRETQTIKGESNRQTTDLRRTGMRDCMSNGLARPYAELPSGANVRKTAAPRPKPTATVVPTANRPTRSGSSHGGPASGEASASPTR